MLERFYDDEVGNTCIYSEKRLESTINDIRFVGSFDRLEKNNFGNYILVDYKTGSSIKHKEDDVISCIQGLLYAYMIEKELGIKVSRCEFRYPFVGNKAIKINYDNVNKQALLDKVEEFKKDISTHIPFNEGEASFIDKYERLLSLFKEASRHD